MKKNAKKSKENMPDLVTAMLKLVERLESLEKKTDMVLGRVSSLPTEFRQAVANLPRPEPFRNPQPSPNPLNPAQPQGVREKILFDATCADCLKACRVPFRPSENRPVYCPACFAIRKAGHAPKDLASNIVVPQHLRDLKKVPVVADKGDNAAPKIKKPVSKTSKKPAKKKKK